VVACLGGDDDDDDDAPPYSLREVLAGLGFKSSKAESLEEDTVQSPGSSFGRLLPHASHASRRGSSHSSVHAAHALSMAAQIQKRSEIEHL